jgi:hypothetical protein
MLSDVYHHMMQLIKIYDRVLGVKSFNILGLEPRELRIACVWNRVIAQAWGSALGE